MMLGGGGVSCPAIPVVRVGLLSRGRGVVARRRRLGVGILRLALALALTLRLGLRLRLGLSLSHEGRIPSHSVGVRVREGVIH
jgi:hypothetical protein